MIDRLQVPPCAELTRGHGSFSSQAMRDFIQVKLKVSTRGVGAAVAHHDVVFV